MVEADILKEKKNHGRWGINNYSETIYIIKTEKRNPANRALRS